MPAKTNLVPASVIGSPALPQRTTAAPKVLQLVSASVKHKAEQARTTLSQPQPRGLSCTAVLSVPFSTISSLYQSRTGIRS
ncbi:hypothetical protein PTTG_28366 [Puccinia triticina 1-1 BBBD Race 1]|uniref:Uncharacterized protein n=1 Tax=Puccinia triticina (isolate 1-1 / race 1 (BBBD)) TaxID=630390 RepID=A0A180GCY0_PUCT1|nr:hypothetical protein PTTG_28366 [Puccinia triticina 1-1 BBBD Race 1]